MEVLKNPKKTQLVVTLMALYTIFNVPQNIKVKVKVS